VSQTSDPNQQRIAKLLARAGIASRREIERMIADGRIALNGKTLDTPATVLASLEGVTVDGHPVEAPKAARLFRYHKPSGLLTAERDFTGRPTIYDRMPQGLPRVMPVGRLDLNTEGLLLLTTDGELKRELELPASGVERSYRARAYGNVTQEQLEDLMLGVEIEGVRYGSINANIERRTGANLWIEMTLTEGKNREVRRVLEHLGLQVSRLIRTRYGPFHLGDLPVGDVDEIRPTDLTTFRTVLGKPGGGKAASNLQFAVRQRVAAPPPPRSEAGIEPAGRRTSRPDNRPGRSPRPTPVREDYRPDNRRGPAREERPARDDARPQRGPVRRDDRAPSGERPRGFTPRGAPDRSERPAREGTRPDARRGTARNDERTAAEPRAARFTPRVTPSARTERPAREDARPVANTARAARAKAHRETREPREGDFVDRPRNPRPPRPTKGPSGGRGKPSKPARPPRTRK
jgi:23S rRNA pseudouridine2605 synthase